MKFVPTFVVVVLNARNRCTQYLDATGKRRARCEHAHKFISRGRQKSSPSSTMGACSNTRQGLSRNDVGA
jgi:hypothetical protein